MVERVVSIAKVIAIEMSCFELSVIVGGQRN